MKRVAAQHADWLSLIEPSGAFLTLPVLRRVFPQGLGLTAVDTRAAVRDALEELTDDPAERTTWLRYLLFDLLEWGPPLVEGPAIPSALTHVVAEYAVTLRPDFVLTDAPQGDSAPRARLLVCRWPLHTALDQRASALAAGKGDRWAASPIERAVTLCRETNVPLALVTDTDNFALVWAPRNGAAGWATWPSNLFADERTLLDSFVSVLGARRFFGVARGDRLEALFEESAGAQAEVTGQLGKQVREAVELLVGAISRGDRASRGELLVGIGDSEVYEAAVTVLMRLVFLLSAEERRLFPVDDDLYAESYAVTTLRAQLQEQANRDGPEVLERHDTAWYRLLATFRAVFGGIQHERLRLPPYGGRLFDPDRFPFLEGRTVGSPEQDAEARPLPVDDRTILAVLDALQVLTFREGGVTEARHVSYRTLDIEQIGHVYEGLLEQGALRARTTVLGLIGKKSEEPEIALEELEAQLAKGSEPFIEWLAEASGKTANQLRKLFVEPDLLRQEHVRAASENDARVYPRVMRFAGLLRNDLRGLPLVFLGPATYDHGRVPGALYVTKTSERRESGTQYTTKDLADEVVRYALEPIVYSPGPAEGADPAEWRLKSSTQLLKLKVCDPAVGSGAILVAACRYLAERLVEAWQAEMERDEQPAGLPPGFVPGEDLELLARRVVTDHCLFGVDRNPMAAEMAKLSLWLTTMSKERPFTFLDHAIHCGDSLLGITSLEQIEAFHLDPKRGRELHQRGHTEQMWGIAEPLAKRREVALAHGRKLSEITVLELRDADQKRQFHERLTNELSDLQAVGDLLVGAALATAGKGGRALETELRRLMFEYLGPAYEKSRTVDELKERIGDIRTQAAYLLDTGRPERAPDRKPLHWPLAFPEVFLDPERPAGFDAVVGNPPFLGGQRITGAFGTSFRDYLVENLAGGRKGSADVVAYFYLRCTQISSGIGMLATNTIAQGDTREVGLDWLLGDGAWTIHHAVRSRPWPGQAGVDVAQLWLRQGLWKGERLLDGQRVRGITASLEPESRAPGSPKRLRENTGVSFIGSYVLGMGFVMEPNEAKRLIDRDARNAEVLFPYLNGEDLNESPTQTPSRWVINFFDWRVDQAERYEDCFVMVREKVKPERDLNNRKARRERWWQYAERAPALYNAIAGMDRVMCRAITSKHHAFSFVSLPLVIDQTAPVIAYDDYFHFGLLQSEIHAAWWLRWGPTMRIWRRYTPSDVFETFPQPAYSGTVETAGNALDDHRRPLMISNNEGLTKTYNRVHNSKEESSGIARLRDLHRELDVAVRDAYGWSDLDLDHGFHETSQGVRYTFGPAARTEVLDRLLESNHQRYAEEVEAGLHDKKGGRAKGKKATAVSMVAS